MTTKTAEIAALNDLLRTGKNSDLGMAFVTSGIASLPLPHQIAILLKVQQFDAFTPDNDPYNEHDFGAFEHEGRKVFWKIDYYNRTMDGGSEDPADPIETRRVLTVMLASEY